MRYEDEWNDTVEKNSDPYGKCCVDVARRVMEVLGKGEEFDPHNIICQADTDTKAGGITGFMSGCVAQMVTRHSERGDEFMRKWNGDVQIGNEGDKASEKGAVLNPALLNISV